MARLQPWIRILGPERAELSGNAAAHSAILATPPFPSISTTPYPLLSLLTLSSKTPLSPETKQIFNRPYLPPVLQIQKVKNLKLKKLIQMGGFCSVNEHYGKEPILLPIFTW